MENKAKVRRDAVNRFIVWFTPNPLFIQDLKESADEFFEHEKLIDENEFVEILSPTDAVINVFYFGANHPHDFVEKVWSDKPHLAKHLQEKLDASNGFFDFFFELNLHNKRKLIEWANENYSCGMY